MSMEQLAILAITGLAAGFAGGLFGIGGGVIIVPALYGVFLANGVPQEICIKVAVGTSLATIIVTSVRSLQAHHRRGNVEWSLLSAWGLWIALGALVGAGLARFATAKALTLFFGVMLFLLAIRKITSRPVSPQDAGGELPAVGIQRGIGGGVGLVSSLLGIGGGVLGVLILTRFGRTVHRAVGTASGFGLVIAVPGTLGYIISGWGQAGSVSGALGFVSIPAFLAIALGTALAAPLGAAMASRLSADRLNLVFSIYMVATSVLMIREGLTS